MLIWGALGVGAALVSVIALVKGRSLRAERAFPPEGQFITVLGRSVHAVQLGHGVDVVLLHGSMGSTRDMTFRLAPLLAASGFRVTVFDRPGLGYTPPLARRGVTIDQQVDLLVAAARALEVTRPVVVGQSFGGALAANWATRFPEDISALVSISGATHPWSGPLDLTYRVLAMPVLGRALAGLVCAFMPRRILHRMVERVFEPEAMPEGYIDYYGPRLNLAPRRLCANAQQRTDLREHLRAQAPHYPEIACPVEIIHGESDETVSLDIHARPLAGDVTDALLTILPTVGHMPHHTAAGPCAEVIARAALRAGLK